MNLTDQNRKTLLQERRIGYVFSSLILSFGGLFNLMYFVMSVHINLLVIILVDTGLLSLSFVIAQAMNRQLNKDLKEGIKNIRIEKVEKKVTGISYEAGSGTLHVPVLGNLFPKLWGQTMRPSDKWEFIINGHTYEVGKEVFEKVKDGDAVEMHYAKNSDTLLGIEFH